MKSVTLKNIADACNTSVGTVSRALANKPDISTATKTLIINTAREMGYIRTEKEAIPLELHKIYVLVSSSRDFFFGEMRRGIYQASEELQRDGIEIEILSSPFEQEEQIDVLSKLEITANDALIVCSAGRRIGDYIDHFVDNGIPVATLYTDASSSKRLFFCGIDAYSSGRLCAGIMGRFMAKKGKVLILGCFSGNETLDNRFAGFCSVMQEDFSDIEIVPLLQPEDNEEIAFRTIRDYLTRNPEISGIFPTTYHYIHGVLKACMELQRKDITVVGYDTSPLVLECLYNDYCDAIIYQNPYLQGYMSVKSMAQYLLNKSLPNDNLINISSRIITKYNAKMVISANC